MKQIKVVSLFCGCGGADLGILGGFSYLNRKFRRLNTKVVHASDICGKAVSTYNHNFEHKAVVRDIHNLSFHRGAADIVVGGFPCQPFSTVNPTKCPEKIDNQLFWQMANVISQVNPSVFIAENVKGFRVLEKGRYFNLAIQEFTRLGYRTYDKILNSSDYGVPQLRERLLIVGVRKDLEQKFVFPAPTHGPSSRMRTEKTKLGDVIRSLVPEHEKYYFSQRAVDGVKRAKPNMKRALAQSLDAQCLTITSHLAKVSLNSRDPVLMVDPMRELYRRFTPREAARIQSFPEEFVFPGSEASAYKQIGNAVPPVLMWNLMNAIIKQLF